MRQNNTSSYVLSTAMRTRAAGMKNTMLSRIPTPPSYLDEEFWQEMLTRKITLALLVIYSIVFILGTVGNGLVIFILGFCMKKTVSTIWFLNLAVANFIFASSLPLRITHNAMKLHWPFGKAMCKLNDSIAYLNLYASAYFLALLSIEHCASFRSSVWAPSLRRNCFAWAMASGVWFLALVLSSPRIHFRKAEPSPIDEEVTICFLNYGQGFKQAKINHYVVLISQYIFAFVVPISVTVACHLKNIQRQRHETQQVKPFNVLLAVTAIFYLYWLPYHVLSFFESQHLETSKILTATIPLATGLAFASSCINPIVYITIGYDFKERPRPSILSAFENVFGEESGSSVPETQAKPAAETNSPEL